MQRYISLGVLIGLAVVMLISLSGCGILGKKSPSKEQGVSSSSSNAGSGDAPAIEIGNGTYNYIVLDNVKRDGATFTFQAVVIDRPGWLVIHPFKEGKPSQTVYVGAKLLKPGAHSDVSIDIERAPASGEMFVVMLHYDVNEDGIFDFNDGIDVLDAPVFEGNRLVALRFAAP